MQENLQDLRQKNIEKTIKDIASSVSKETLLIQSVHMLEELDKVLNRLVKALREWYAYYNPEFEHSIGDHESFTRFIITKTKEELLKELNVTNTMGAKLEQKDQEMIIDTAKDIYTLYKRREKVVEYIEDISFDIMPNVVTVAGATVGSKMLVIAKSLKRLALFPASTIQLLGAEEALFLHIKTGKACPKHGVLINHPLVTNASKKDKGKVARAVADKIAIAAKVDYFKGQFIGETLKKELEKTQKMKKTITTKVKDAYRKFTIIMGIILFSVIAPLVWHRLEDKKLYYMVTLICIGFMIVSEIAKRIFKKKKSFVREYFDSAFVYSTMTLGCFLILFLLVSQGYLFFAKIWMFPSSLSLTLMLTKARFLMGFI